MKELAVGKHELHVSNQAIQAEVVTSLNLAAYRPEVNRISHYIMVVRVLVRKKKTA